MINPAKPGRRNLWMSAAARNSRPAAGNPRPAAPMSRGQFIRTAGMMGGAAAAAGLGLSGVARAAYGDPKPYPTNIDGNTGDSVITVYPTNDPNKDSVTVQWAVDNVLEGGKVLLAAGVFNFGLATYDGNAIVEGIGTYYGYTWTGKWIPSPCHTVNITRSVIIEGVPSATETVRDEYGAVAKHNLTTKIIGGISPFLCNEKVNLAINNIHFEKWYESAISVGKSSGVKISNCNVLQGYPCDTTGGPFYLPFEKYAIGIYPFSGTIWDLNNIEGDVSITDNFVECWDGDDATRGFWDGITVGICNVNLTFSGNTVQRVNNVGIWVDGNAGPTTISNNTFKLGDIQHNEGWWWRMAIYGGSVWGAMYSGIPAGNTIMTGNYIEGTDGTQDGIGFSNGTNQKEGNSLYLGKNTINLNSDIFHMVSVPGMGDIPVPSMHASFVNVKDAVINQNTLFGQAAFGIMSYVVYPVFPVFNPNVGTVIVGNDLRNFTSGIAQIYLDGFDNEVTTKDNVISKNFFGPSPYGVGVYCAGLNNTFDKNNMHNMATLVSLYFDPMSANNLAVLGNGDYAVVDFGFNNTIVGKKKELDPSQLQQLKDKLAEAKELLKDAKRM